MASLSMHTTPTLSIELSKKEREKSLAYETLAQLETAMGNSDAAKQLDDTSSTSYAAETQPSDNCRYDCANGFLPCPINVAKIAADSSMSYANKNTLAKMHWWNAPSQPQPQTQPVRFTKNNESAAYSTHLHVEMLDSAALPSDVNIKAGSQSNVSSFSNPHGQLHSHSHNQCHSLATTPKNRHPKICPLQTDPYFSQTANGQDNDENISQDSKLLVEDPKPCVGVLNVDEEDEMHVTGYRRCLSRTFFCWLCICLTGGLLRLVLHWWNHWYLIATHRACPLNEAEKVLIRDNYQGKHTTFYVKKVQEINASSFRHEYQEQDAAKKQPNQQEEGFSHLSVHFSSAQFKSYSCAKIFTCKQLRYVWDNDTDAFKKLKGLDENVPSTYFNVRQGLPLQEQLSRRVVFGPNDITVPYKDALTLLFLEVLNPFYVFQIFSVVLWFTYDYYYYACVILLMSIFGITMSVIQTKKNQDALRETVQNADCALVLNEKGEVQQIATQNLVPGDVIEIPSSGCKMQCDAVLLSGNCILDESMLTGESVPVTKTPLPIKRDLIYDKKEHARHTLFCGTHVIQTRYIESEKVLALVINTGNITAKGGLIRSIIYPPPVDYKFEQDSYKFIECLALIALVGFVYTLVTKILREIDPVKIAVESLDLITIVVPPALPAAMTVGRYYAQKRLERQNIYCISPRSINVAGSIDCCCFDKTGTLTEDGLDMWGVVPKSATNQFQIPMKDIARLPNDNLLFGMVTCHSITIINGKVVGDPLDLKMFESTGWTLEDAKDIPDSQKYGLIHPAIVRQPKTTKKERSSLQMDQRQSSVDDLLADVGLLHGETSNDHGIVREFPFTSSLQRMSVITRRLSERNFNVYCKGSPEMIQQLCDPCSLPDDFEQQLAKYANKGYRVIAMAFKALSPKMNYTKTQRLTRESVESDLLFLGFVVLENRLKKDTTQVIHSLTAANIRTVMVTGDNILTALSVARDCGIVSETQAVVTVNVRSRSNNDEHAEHNHELYYTLHVGKKKFNASALDAFNCANNVNKQHLKEREYEALNGDVTSLNSASFTLPNSSSLVSVQTCDTWTHGDVEVGLNNSNKLDISQLDHAKDQQILNGDWRSNYCFAMVGKTWQIVRDHFPDELRYFLTRGAIYARMSPEQKQCLIMELQNLDYCVAMCGDGANDCGALKVAHTGISLSETESSIASPFTSRNHTIACVPKVIKEGRTALVTSFGIFKYMAAYSMVQFISVMILYSIDSNLTDKQYLYIDLGLISVFAFFFGKTESFDGPLVKQVPLSSLISLTPLASIALHLCVVVIFQVAAWFQLHHQPWFKPFQFADESHLGCYENYTMFAVSSFQYIILAFVFSKGAPYRKPTWSNIPFCLTLIINLCIVIYLVINPADWLAKFFQLIVPPEIGFRYWMLVYGALNFVLHLFVESVVVEIFLFKKFQVRREQNTRTSTRQYKKIEYELEQFNNWPEISKEYMPLNTDQEEPTPTYIKISAEQNFESPPPKNNALNSFFGSDPENIEKSQAAAESPLSTK